MRESGSRLKEIIETPAFDKILSSVGMKGLWASLRVRYGKMRQLAIAKRVYDKGKGAGSYEDYKDALGKHWVSYNEYALQYDFPPKPEQVREEYVSRLKMKYFVWKYIPASVQYIFKDKVLFLSFFKSFVHREWLYAPDATFDEFVSLVSRYDCIVKPKAGSLGQGIFKTCKDSVRDIRALYDSCVKGRMLVEQYIESCDELSAFHPQSLNSIRVVTVSNQEKAEVFGSFFRMGGGASIVDNAHAGGIFAQINVETGVIESDGINTKGQRFPFHPDSRLKIKGFKIPKWDLICKTCSEAATMTKNTLTGWDVVINKSGEIEFVEGNNAPDFDVMQSPLQVGVKNRLFSLIKEYSGVEME